MAFIRNTFLILVIASSSCSVQSAKVNGPEPSPLPDKKAVVETVADSFEYPIGKTGTETQAKDRDDWYNALDFGASDHLGEDWNKNSGGNSDCGEPVFAAANGKVTFASDAGPGWGNVVIIEHELPSGERVQTLYGHMQEILKTEGEVKKRDQIGKIGNANGRYFCHLHFELRTLDSIMWNKAGDGYSKDRKGWLARRILLISKGNRRDVQQQQPTNELAGLNHWDTCRHVIFTIDQFLPFLNGAVARL